MKSIKKEDIIPTTDQDAIAGHHEKPEEVFVDNSPFCWRDTMADGLVPFKNVFDNLREIFKTPVILTPGAVTVGYELQFVLHFRGIRGGAQKSCFGGPLSQLRFREI